MQPFLFLLSSKSACDTTLPGNHIYLLDSTDFQAIAFTCWTTLTSNTHDSLLRLESKSVEQSYDSTHLHSS